MLKTKGWVLTTVRQATPSKSGFKPCLLQNSGHFKISIETFKRSVSCQLLLDQDKVTAFFSKSRSKPKILHVLFFWGVEKFSCFLLYQNSQNLMGPLVPCSAQSKVSAEFRPGCSGLCQADNTFRDRDSTTLPLNLLQCFLTLTVSPVLCPRCSDSCSSCGLMVQPGSGSPVTSPWGLADGSSVFPKPSLFLAKPALFPQPLSLGHVFLLPQKSWEIIFSLIITLVSFQIAKKLPSALFSRRLIISVVQKETTQNKNDLFLVSHLKSASWVTLPECDTRY